MIKNIKNKKKNNKIEIGSEFVVSFCSILFLLFAANCNYSQKLRFDQDRQSTDYVSSKDAIVIKKDVLQFQTDDVANKADIQNKFIIRYWYNDSLYEQEDFWDYKYSSKYIHTSKGDIYSIFNEDTFLYYNPSKRHEKVMCWNLSKDTNSYPMAGFVVDSMLIDKDEKVYLIEFIENRFKDISVIDYKWNIANKHLRYIIHPKIGIIAEQELKLFSNPEIYFKKNESISSAINTYRLVYYKSDTTTNYYNFKLPISWELGGDWKYYWKR